MIRPAAPQDIPAAVGLSIEALSIDPYQELVISRERVYAMVKECVCNAKHFSWVSEVDGTIQGGLAALVEPFLMYDRNQAMIVMWYCKAPGDGVRLMREFARWVNGRPLIKQVVYGGERGADPRIATLVRRIMKTMGRVEVLPMTVVTR